MRTKTRLRLNILFIILLILMLVGTTYALFSILLRVDGNYFETGSVGILLNDNKKVFDGSDLNFQPHGRVTKPLTVQNVGSGDIYYRIFLTNVEGSLKDTLIFNIYDGSQLVKTVAPSDFTEDNALVSDIALPIGAVKTYQIEAVMADCAGNGYGNHFVSFDFVARAVQSKNNPQKEF